MTEDKTPSDLESNGLPESAGSGATSGDSWPTDPKSLGIDPAEIAVDAHGDWKPAHHKLLTSLGLAYRDLVNRTLGTVSREIGQPLNGWDFRRSKGPRQVTHDAEGELKDLQRRSAQHRDARKTLPLPSDTNPPTGYDWLKLIALLAVCIVLEAVANVTLLARALSTGLVGAFITAVLVSAINVGALGAGGGLTLSGVRRHSKSRVPFLTGCGLLVVAATALNLIVGRHREAFARLIEEREQQTLEATEVSLASVRELAAGISFNPVTWELESLLFLALGLALCAVGFYKGFTFVKTGVKRKEAEESLDREWNEIKERYTTLSERYRKKLTQGLRADVAGWIEELDRKRRRARNVLEDVKESWEKGSYLDFVESDFIVAHNKHNADKIDREMVDSHRESVNVDWSFPATPADWHILDEADEIVAAWRDSGQEAFFESVHLECEKVADLWKRYESVILGPAAAKGTHSTG